MKSDRTAAEDDQSGESRPSEPATSIEFELQMKLARDIMEHWKDALRALAE